MPDNKEISALTTAEQTSNNDLLETSIPNAMTDTGYISRKQSVTMLEQQMLGNTQYNTELPNFTAGNRTIFKALEEARSSGGGGGASANEALPYDSTASYSWGDYCIYNNYLWRCTSTSGATGTWDATKWVAVMVTDEYMRVRVMNTSAYNQLSSAEKAGAIFVTDYQSKIQDIDNVSLTTSDDGKLLGVSVSGSDISVGAVTIYPLFQISAEIQGSTVNIASNSWGDSMVAIPTVSGYRPIAFYKVYPNSPANLCINSFDIEETQGTYTGRIRLRSFSSSAIDANARVSILYIRES